MKKYFIAILLLSIATCSQAQTESKNNADEIASAK